MQTEATTSETAKEKINQLILRIRGLTDFQEIIDKASEFLQNPMAIYDIAYSLWASTDSGYIDDPLWIELTQTGTFSPKTVKYIQAHFVEAYMKCSLASHMISPLKYDRINGGIFDREGVQIANILMLDSNRPFNEDDFEIIKALCDYVSSLIERWGMVKRSRMYDDAFMSYLLEGGATDTNLYEQELRELCLNLKKVYYVGVVDIMQFDSTLTHIVYFYEHFKKMRKEFKYFIYLNNIIILMSFNEIPLSIEKELKDFKLFFSEFDMYAGVSGYFFDLKEIDKNFKNALNALNYGLLSGGGGNIFCHDIYRIELFVNSRLDETNVYDLCNPLVFQIDEYDKLHKTCHIRLIYTYLLFGMDYKRTAESMQVSVAELRQQLRRASKLFEIDWKNGNLLFSLMRSIRLLRCFPDSLKKNK